MRVLRTRITQFPVFSPSPNLGKAGAEGLITAPAF